jgi:hypothetical protein
MKKNCLLGLLLTTIGLSTGCATVTTGTSQTIAVDTKPSGADCRFTREGDPVASINPTPGVITVSKDDRRLDVLCRKDGYQDGVADLASTFQAMTVGNVLIGGVVGLIIDAASGAATKYPSSVTITLIPESFASIAERDAFFDAMRTEFLTEYESTVKEIKDRCKQEDGCYDQMVKAEYSREARLAEIERQRATAKIVGLATAAASLTAPVSSAEKLEALQRLYNYEVIDEEEYREKRKLISDQQAAQEVETPQAQAQGASQQGAAGLAGATAATVGATSSAKSEPAVPARLRVAILPFATSSGTAIGYAEIVEVSHDYVHGQPDLQLVYSTHRQNSGNDPASSGVGELWSGGYGEQRPVETNVYRLAEQIPADLALMYFYRKRVAGWYASELYVFDVYLIDVRRRQVHHRSGDERSLKKMTESVFENIPAASSISSAEPPSTVSRSVTALNK